MKVSTLAKPSKTKLLGIIEAPTVVKPIGAIELDKISHCYKLGNYIANTT